MNIWPAGILVALVLSGCLNGQPPDAEEKGGAQFTWGLGLPVPEILPPLGDFVEPMEEVVYWDQFLQENHRLFREPCKPGGGVRLPSDGAPFFVRLNLTVLFVGCTPTALEGFSLENLRANVHESLHKNRANLSGFEEYASVSAVEMAAALMSEHLMGELAFEEMERRYAALTTANATTGWHSLHMEYEELAGSAEVMARILAFAPLGGDRCHNSWTEVATSVLAGVEGLNATMAAMEAKGLLPPVHFGTEVDRFRYAVLPIARLAAAAGWWPSLLATAGTIPMDEAYLDLALGSVLPTYDEALFIHATIMNTSRSISNDLFLLARLEFDYPTLWETDPEYGLGVLAARDLEWRFDRVTCI